MGVAPVFRGSGKHVDTARHVQRTRIDLGDIIPPEAEHARQGL